MTKPLKANKGRIATRYPPIHDRVVEALERIEPGRYGALLKQLRAEWKPVGHEIHIIELMADLNCRLRGCAYLEAEVLREGMEACAGPGVTRGMALGRAFIRDVDGPNLLDRISQYENRLSRELSGCIRMLTESRRRRELARARKEEKLLRTTPCTSVIQ